MDQRVNDRQTRILERHDLDKDLHQCQQLIEMIDTEEIVELDSIEFIDKRVSSVRTGPGNEVKRCELLQKHRRAIVFSSS